jgi:hypothetical protein
MSPLAVSKNIFTPFSTVPLFRLGNVLSEHFAKLIGEGCHDFWKESVWECKK